jgi:hypothetical protein
MVTIDIEELLRYTVDVFVIICIIVFLILLFKIILLVIRINKLVINSEESVKKTIKNISDISENTSNLVFDIKSVVDSSSKTIIGSASILTDVILTVIKIIRKKLI